MTLSTPEVSDLEAVDRALAEWRQGDCSLGEFCFMHRYAQELPLTQAAKDAAEQGSDIAKSAFAGFVVVSQTCDIIRPCSKRPLVNLSPLVQADENQHEQIRRGRMPYYAYIPNLADRRLVAFLDQIESVEKPVLAVCERFPGWSTDAESREFTEALKRKFGRFAFPDDFTALCGALRDHLKMKPQKRTQPDRALQALSEIRVQAFPSWEAKTVELLFWFVRPFAETDFEGVSWEDLKNEWLALVPLTGRFQEINGLVTHLEEINGTDLLGSDPLDLDYLTISEPGKLR